MQIINLHKFYPDYYPKNCFITVEDEIAAAMKPHRLEDQSHWRRMRYNKVLSLDADDGVENKVVQFVPSPEELLLQKIALEQLREALFQTLPVQRQRLYCHYILGMKKADISRQEGVSRGRVSESIQAGLRSLRRFYEQNGWTL